MKRKKVKAWARLDYLGESLMWGYEPETHRHGIMLIFISKETAKAAGGKVVPVTITIEEKK